MSESLKPLTPAAQTLLTIFREYGASCGTQTSTVVYTNSDGSRATFKTQPSVLQQLVKHKHIKRQKHSEYLNNYTYVYAKPGEVDEIRKQERVAYEEQRQKRREYERQQDELRETKITGLIPRMLDLKNMIDPEGAARTIIEEIASHARDGDL